MYDLHVFQLELAAFFFDRFRDGMSSEGTAGQIRDGHTFKLLVFYFHRRMQYEKIILTCPIAFLLSVTSSIFFLERAT